MQFFIIRTYLACYFSYDIFVNSRSKIAIIMIFIFLLLTSRMVGSFMHEDQPMKKELIAYKIDTDPGPSSLEV